MDFYYIKWNGVLQNILVLRHFLTTKALQNDPRKKYLYKVRFNDRWTDLSFQFQGIISNPFGNT